MRRRRRLPSVRPYTERDLKSLPMTLHSHHMQRLLDVSYATLGRRIKQGTLKPMPKGGPPYWWPKVEVLRVLGFVARALAGLALALLDL